MSVVVVAVDGPSGSGKSSVSKGVAKRFGLKYLDTGAMYRAMTWFMLNAQIDLEDADAVAAACEQPSIVSGMEPSAPTIHVDGIDVGEVIRSPEVTAGVSLVSAVPKVREQMVALQRYEVANSVKDGVGVVVEGRDIGSTVLPNADVKIYLTADPAIRAERRAAEDAGRKHGSAGVAATQESLQRRDELDSQRKASPLRSADDAHHVDATYLDLQQTIDTVSEIVDRAVLEESR